MNGFKRFLLRGNVIDLAVAVVIGAAFGAVVASFVKSILTPLIAAIGGQPNFNSLSFTINKSIFLYGEFLNAVISFAIIAAVVYFLVVLPMNTIMDRARRNAPVAALTTKPCPECLSDIPLAARRCAFCASSVVEQVAP